MDALMYFLKKGGAGEVVGLTIFSIKKLPLIESSFLLIG